MLKIFWFFKVLKDVYRKRADVTLFFFKKRGHRGNVIKTQGFPWAALGSPSPSRPTSVAKLRGMEGRTEPALGQRSRGHLIVSGSAPVHTRRLSTPGPLQGLAPLPVPSTHLQFQFLGFVCRVSVCPGESLASPN